MGIHDRYAPISQGAGQGEKEPYMQTTYLGSLQTMSYVLITDSVSLQRGYITVSKALTVLLSLRSFAY